MYEDAAIVSPDFSTACSGDAIYLLFPELFAPFLCEQLHFSVNFFAGCRLLHSFSLKTITSN